MDEMNSFEEPKDDISSNAESDQRQTNLMNEAMNIQNLVKFGIINPQQGQYYMSRLAGNLQRLKQDMDNQEASDVNPFEEFNAEKPDFFKAEGREDVLNYLKNACIDFDKDEIGIISDMVEKIEKCAIERYVKQLAHDEALNSENEAAKRRLTANAQNTNFSANKNKAFTREQIGKMSSAEFTKNEPLIMEQLRKGQIR